MPRTVFTLAVAVFVLVHCVPRSSSAQKFDVGSKDVLFGSEWPDLEKCLTAGPWNNYDHAKYTFNKDGTFSRHKIWLRGGGVDEFGRKQEAQKTTELLIGKWKLYKDKPKEMHLKQVFGDYPPVPKKVVRTSDRFFDPSAREYLLKISNHKLTGNEAYYLELFFAGNAMVEEPKDAEGNPIFGRDPNGRVLLVLNETTTTLTRLRWHLVESNLTGQLLTWRLDTTGKQDKGSYSDYRYYPTVFHSTKEDWSAGE